METYIFIRRCLIEMKMFLTRNVVIFVLCVISVVLTFFLNVTWENSPIQYRDDESLEGQKIKSKKIEELANGAEKDAETLNKMYEKYAEIKDNDTVINNIYFNLINAQCDLKEWASYNKNK